MALEMDNRSAGWSRLASSVLMQAAGAVCILAAIKLLLHVRSAPYNLPKLFTTKHPLASEAVFAYLLIWIGLAPAWLAALAARYPRLIPALPAGAALVTLASWFMLNFAVTVEGLQKVLGTPVLNWGGGWELLGRFLALHGGMILILMVAGVAAATAYQAGLRAATCRSVLALLYALPWLVLARTVVITWADTDNLTELLRAEPVPGDLWLALLAMLIALNAAGAAYALSSLRPRRWLAAALMTLLLVPAGWGLLKMGLEPSVHKYGLVFPAEQFLLGPNRASLLSEQQLFLRWALVQLAAVGVLVFGGLCALRLRSHQPVPARAEPVGAPSQASAPPPDSLPALNADAPPTTPHPGRAYAILVGVYVLFLMYGCVVPLDFQDIPFDQAWYTFFHTDRLWQARTGPADMLANILLFVPLTFCAMGALTRENTRPWRWLLAPLVVLGGGLLSTELEFSQLFVPVRTVSIHDIISQTIGGVIGLAAWATLGTPVTRWVRGLLGERDVRLLAIKILATYAGLLVFYRLLPLTLTISLTRIHRRLTSGMITLIPFADLARQDPYKLVTQAAAMVPVGFLMCLLVSPQPGRMRRACLRALAFAAGLELLQVFVMSAYASATDAVFGGLGGVLGAVLAEGFGPAARRPVIEQPAWRRWGRPIKAGATLVWLATLAWDLWSLPANAPSQGRLLPFQPCWPAEGFWAQAKLMLRAPLVGELGQRSPLRALSQDMGLLALFFVLGLLLRSLVPPRRWSRLWAALTALTAAIVLEGGQIFFPPRSADATSLALEATGAVAGVMMYELFVRIFIHGEAHERQLRMDATQTLGTR